MSHSSFKQFANSLLIEGNGSYDKCSTQVNIVREKHTILKIVKSVLDTDLAEDGREMTPHITILYGILNAKDSVANVKEALAVDGISKIKAVIGDCSLFKRHDEGFEVVKFDIISDDLHTIRDAIEEHCEYQTKYPNYQPHLTIAYVKPGEGDKYVQKFRKLLAGTKLEFNSIFFSNLNGDLTEIPLSPIQEDLGYGGSSNSSGNASMSGHLGIYNSPTVQSSLSNKYNMKNNNTVIASNYYDTIFDSDIQKVLEVFKDFGFDADMPANDEDDKFDMRAPSAYGMRHVASDLDSMRHETNSAFEDTTGLNLAKETIHKYLRIQLGEPKYDELKKNYEKNGNVKINYDEVKTGLVDEMGDMKFPDKDYACLKVMKNLLTNPRYYSGLAKYDIKETRQIYGMEVNLNEIKKIMKEMKI